MTYSGFLPVITAVLCALTVFFILRVNVGKNEEVPEDTSMQLSSRYRDMLNTVKEINRLQERLQDKCSRVSSKLSRESPNSKNASRMESVWCDLMDLENKFADLARCIEAMGPVVSNSLLFDKLCDDKRLENKYDVEG